MNLLNYRLTTRIAAGFAAMVLLMLVLGATSVWTLRSNTAEAQALLAASASAALMAKATALQQTADRAALLIGLLVGLAALFGAWLGWAVRRSVKAPVEQVVEAVTRIAKGDLVTKISSTGRDEIA
ncbi:HAMP domain-containing protein, partial [Methylibium sp.]|uniref:HAMP domain-containing protein n=1 Tax=Methylibium sp. TaxID=2067992 RepID=UPI00182BEB6C